MKAKKNKKKNKVKNNLTSKITNVMHLYFSKINDKEIFKFAVMLLPFENFFFAPSRGWATITPIILFLYMIVNYKYLLEYMYKYKKYIMIGVGVLLINIFVSLFTVVNFKNIVNALIPIMLGITLLISFNIYYSKEKEIKTLSKIIYNSYGLALIIGFIQFISIKFNIDFMYSIFDFLFKRNYFAYNRVQFFFTEPSFIGMHLFGVLLPYYMFTKEKPILKLLIVFSIASIIFSSGVRILLDIFVVTLVFFIGYLLRKKMYKQLLIIPIIGLLILGFMYNQNYRVKQIVDKGIYADGSLASRYFRIQASVYGYIKKPIQTLVGYGMGNSIIPLRDGYDLAKKQYKSSYVKEINELGNPSYYDDSVSYCLYTRFISEFGLIIFIIALKWLISITQKSGMKFKYEYLVVTLYLYLQFESYAFYALWIFILAMLYTKRKNKTI